MSEKIYAVEVTTEDGNLHTFFSSGKDELEAIDKVANAFEKQGRKFTDIRIMKG